MKKSLRDTDRGSHAPHAFDLTRRSALAAFGSGLAAGGLVSGDVVAAAAGPTQRDGNIAYAATLAEARALRIPSNIERIAIGGREAPHAGAAMYRAYNGAAPSEAARAFPRTRFLSSDGRLFSIDLDQKIDARAVGAVGDGIADDLPALQEFLDSLGSIASNPLERRVTLDLGAGHYRLSGPLRPRQNMITLLSAGAVLDGGKSAITLIRADHQNSVNSLTWFRIDGHLFVRDCLGDAISLESAPLFAFDEITANRVGGDVVAVSGSVGGRVRGINAYDCGGFAYREKGLLKRYPGDRGGAMCNCVHNYVERIRAFRCGGGYAAHESLQPLIGELDIESSRGPAVLIESCLQLRICSMYEEDHAVGIIERRRRGIYGDDFPTGGTQIDWMQTSGQKVQDRMPIAYRAEYAEGTRIVAGRIGGAVEIGPGAEDVVVGAGLDVLGELRDRGVRTRVTRRFRGVTAMAAGSVVADIAFPHAELDARYNARITAIRWTGSPTPQSMTAMAQSPTRGGFQLRLLAPVPPGSSVDFLIELV